jgi:uncharacterized DUF497 family protein
MKYVDWNAEKNETLRVEREVCFDDVVVAIDEGRVLDVIEHPNSRKYKHQQQIIVSIQGYAYIVPFVEDDEKIFLKTIIPSRKATKKYLIK